MASPARSSCPICGQRVPQDRITAHVNACLDAGAPPEPRNPGEPVLDLSGGGPLEEGSDSELGSDDSELEFSPARAPPGARGRPPPRRPGKSEIAGVPERLDVRAEAARLCCPLCAFRFPEAASREEQLGHTARCGRARGADPEPALELLRAQQAEFSEFYESPRARAEEPELPPPLQPPEALRVQGNARIPPRSAAASRRREAAALRTQIMQIDLLLAKLEKRKRALLKQIGRLVPGEAEYFSSEDEALVSSAPNTPPRGVGPEFLGLSTPDLRELAQSCGLLTPSRNRASSSSSSAAAEPRSRRSLAARLQTLWERSAPPELPASSSFSNNSNNNNFNNFNNSQSYSQLNGNLQQNAQNARNLQLQQQQQQQQRQQRQQQQQLQFSRSSQLNPLNSNNINRGAEEDPFEQALGNLGAADLEALYPFVGEGDAAFEALDSGDSEDLNEPLRPRRKAARKQPGKKENGKLRRPRDHEEPEEEGEGDGGEEGGELQDSRLQLEELRRRRQEELARNPRQLKRWEQLRAFVRSDDDLYVQVLLFQAIDLPRLQLVLRLAGLRFGRKALMEFLDAEGINFVQNGRAPRKGSQQQQLSQIEEEDEDDDEENSDDQEQEGEGGRKRKKAKVAEKRKRAAPKGRGAAYGYYANYRGRGRGRGRGARA